MTDLGSIAFYAPLKSPNHPAPSGDRTMARLFLKALERAGARPVLASELRTLDKVGDASVQAQMRQRSAAEADRLVARWTALPAAEQPRLWFTYHSYYKAPDWIGPAVARALGIPYVIAEASRAGKRAQGPWSLGHAGAEAAADRAGAIFVMTAADRAALERLKPPDQDLVDCPPFLDLDAWPAVVRPDRTSACPRRLLTVAMMRAGDKLSSYGLLAEALGRLEAELWALDIVGDGEARPDVEALFAGCRDRVRFHGQIDDRKTLASLYAGADLLLWPAVNEAYGLVLLEAQAQGCPVVAARYGGVDSVVRDGETGLLTRPGEVEEFARAVAELLRDGDRRHRLGEAARRFVRETRDLGAAAERIRVTLAAIMAGRRAA